MSLHGISTKQWVHYGISWSCKPIPNAFYTIPTLSIRTLELGIDISETIDIEIVDEIHHVINFSTPCRKTWALLNIFNYRFNFILTFISEENTNQICIVVPQISYGTSATTQDTWVRSWQWGKSYQRKQWCHFTRLCNTGNTFYHIITSSSNISGHHKDKLCYNFTNKLI